MLAARVHGHVWTIGPRLGTKLRGGQLAPDAAPWSIQVPQGARSIRITGRLSEAKGARTLVILLHGCGGSPDSDYCAQAARFFHTRGVSALRLAWRGADLLGEDFYHAGQTAELHAAVEDAARRGYERVWVIGYSLGGHACLRFASETIHPAVRAVATVCPVLDLPGVSRAIDAPQRFLYRRYTLRGLIDAYTKVAERGPVPTPVSEVLRARSFRTYDSLTVVPRYGFADVDDYYESQNVKNVLAKIDKPTFIVSSVHDPMLPVQLAEGARPLLSESTTFRLAQRGGHCFFPTDLDLGEHAPRGLEAQLHCWLEKQ